MILVSSIPVLALDFELGTPTTPSGDPGTSVTVTVDITNNNQDLSKTYNVAGSLLTRSGGTEIIGAPSSTTTGPIAEKGGKGQGSLTINLPVTLAGIYTGTLTVTDTSDSNNKLEVSYKVTVNSKNSIEFFDGSSKLGTLSVRADPKKQTLLKSFTIKNTGSTELTNIQIKSVPLFNNIQITGSVDKSSLKPSESMSGTLTMSIPEDPSIETHEKSITVSSTQLPSASFILELKIQPQICKSGVQGTVKVEIKDPDNGDDFEIGETISIEVDVDNDDTKKHDFVVEAILYDKTNNKKLESVESDEIEIDDGDSEKFDLDLKIPTDEDIDEDDDFALFVKAFQDGKESLNCDEDSIDIDIEVPSHKVIIEDASLTPSSVNCGDTVTATVDVKNVGSSDERLVRIRAREPSLKIDVLSDPFEIEEVGQDDESTQTLTFQVPGDAKAGQYTIELLAEPGTANKVSEFRTLQVSCEVPTSMVELTLPSFTIKVDQGSILDIAVTLKNNANSEKTYTIEAKAVGDFASSDTEQLTLAANEQGSVTLSMNVDSDTDTGSKNVVITVKEGTNIIATKSAAVLVESKGTPITGAVTVGNIFGNTRNAAVFFIIADILLVLIALYIVVLIFRRRKKE